jgi:hypothetical protein
LLVGRWRICSYFSASLVLAPRFVRMISAKEKR